MPEIVDQVVVGGGIVGAATARHLSQRAGAGVLLLDKEDGLGAHQTGHNSGVVHSGIYYEPGSLKAEMCRRGARLTEEYAAERGIAVEKVGKLLVATDEAELAGMRKLEERAAINQIPAEVLDAAELNRREPAVRGLGALWLPGTGITDYKAINRAFAADVVAAGGEVRTGVQVTGIEENTDRVRLTTATGEQVEARQVVFCAGVQSDRMARLAGLDHGVRIVPFRGEYFDVVDSRADLVSSLIYPIPDATLPFLGVHLTPTVEGGLNVGPNAVLGLSREGYPKFSFDRRDAWDIVSYRGMHKVARTYFRTGARELRNSVWKRGYLKQCQKYCPSLTLDDLVPRPAGIRAQAVRRDGSFVHDFLLERTPRTLHVLNAPSPAATSALPIGEELARQVLAA